MNVINPTIESERMRIFIRVLALILLPILIVSILFILIGWSNLPYGTIIFVVDIICLSIALVAATLLIYFTGKNKYYTLNRTIPSFMVRYRSEYNELKKPKFKTITSDGKYIIEITCSNCGYVTEEPFNGFPIEFICQMCGANTTLEDNQ